MVTQNKSVIYNDMGNKRVGNGAVPPFRREQLALLGEPRSGASE